MASEEGDKENTYIEKLYVENVQLFMPKQGKTTKKVAIDNLMSFEVFPSLALILINGREAF